MTSELLPKAAETLIRMYSEERALFSYSAVLEDGSVVNDYDNHLAIRYTINTLVGLQREGSGSPETFDAGGEMLRFISINRDRIVNPGDKGLLLYGLASAGLADEAIRAQVLALAGSKDSLRAMVLQEICWLVIGLSRQASLADDAESAQAARSCLEVILDEFVDPKTGIPGHTVSGPRRRFVSFGGVTYFLMALHHFDKALGDDRAASLFHATCRRIIDLQGERGEWGWFYDSARGVLVDWYEVYSVHQLAMAPLFLIPAVDRGVEGADAALSLGVRWMSGANELAEPMLRLDPFFTWRSIRRRGPATRARRLARAFASVPLRASARQARTGALEINPECRSYELGWFVYAWAEHPEHPSLRELADLIH